MAKRRSEYHQIISSIISPTVAALVVILNLLKLYVIKTKQRQNKSVSIIYLINVSISDITVGILIIVYRTMHLYVDNNAVAEEICKIIQLCLIRISLFVSVFNLVALTLNKMWAIRKPFIHRKYGKKFAIKICFGVWMTSITFVAGLYLLSRYQLRNTKKYTDVVFACVTYPAAIIFIVCYTIIFLAIRQSVKARKEETGGTTQHFVTGQKYGKAKFDRIEVSRENIVISGAATNHCCNDTVKQLLYLFLLVHLVSQ